MPSTPSHRPPLRLRFLLVPAFGLAVIGYLSYHALQGDHGLLAWLDLKAEIETRESELATLAAERRKLEHDVALLRPESLHPDLLDERARAILGYAEADEVTVFRELN